MKSTHVALAVVATLAATTAVVFAALYFTDDSTTDTAARAEACGDRVFGHISSLSPSGDHYELRFDPAWFTSGVTANKAAEEDGAVEPGEPVPNDNYTVEEGHRLLTYLVPDDTPVTVLTREGDPANFGSTPVTVAELAQLVNGAQPVELFEPLESGLWIQVNIDSVCALDQQYRP